MSNAYVLALDLTKIRVVDQVKCILLCISLKNYNFVFMIMQTHNITYKDLFLLPVPGLLIFPELASLHEVDRLALHHHCFQF